MIQRIEMTDEEKLEMYTKQTTHEELARMHIELEKHIPKPKVWAGNVNLSDVVIPQPLREEILSVIYNCKIKLQIYRNQLGGAYAGGIEYTELIKRIEKLCERLSP